MNGTVGKRKSDESTAGNLLEVLDRMKKNLDHMEKVMEVYKNVLTECDSTVQELRSEAAELESLINNRPSLETVRTNGAHLTEDVVAKALKKTTGILSEEQLNTFLYLADSLQDPVQLAKVSFTNDIKMLYYQLIEFHFNLKFANDVAEKENGTSCTNRELENKVERLVLTFEKEVL